MGRPVGNPAAMEIAGAQMTYYAERLEGLSGVSRGLLPSSAFTGPGRAEHAEAFYAITASARDAANQLRAQGAILTREAPRLEAAQKAYDREQERKRVEAARERERERGKR